MPRYKPLTHREGSKLRIIQVRLAPETSDLLDAMGQLKPPMSITEVVEEGIRLVAKKRLKKKDPG